MAKISELTIDLSIGNLEETITELKRVQREAKKATQALKELEEAKRGYDTKEGSVIYHISKHLRISPEDLVTLEPSEIAYLFKMVRGGSANV